MAEIRTLDDFTERAHGLHLKDMPKGKSYKDLSTIIITAIRGEKTEKRQKACPHCGEPVDYDAIISNGIHPLVFESWKRMIRPMNQTIQDLIAIGYEVGDAYEQMVDFILKHDDLKKYKYIMFLEDDIVVPTMANTRGPLWRLYERIADGYDIANGLYWTKGVNGMPLIFGDPANGTSNFECLTDWNPGDIVECNGAGMGFCMMKLDIFRDKRFQRPFFKTLEEVGVGMMTQDLYFYRQARALGYRVCVDTEIRCGHYNSLDGEIY